MSAKKKTTTRKTAARNKATRSVRKTHQSRRGPAMFAVTPQLTCAGADAALAFYKKAFGAVEEVRMAGATGKIVHAVIRIGDSAVMIVDDFPEWGSLGPIALKGSPVTLHLIVKDVDAFVARAVSAGAKVTLPVDDMFWGDRYGKLEDPFGHHWSVATPKRAPDPEEMKAALQQM